MLVIRECIFCHSEFDAEIGSPELVCALCRDAMGGNITDLISLGEVSPVDHMPHSKTDSWEMQSVKLAQKEKAPSATDDVFLKYSGVHLKQKK